ncbi:sodium:solute symporter family protein [Natrarchaeobius sp. A-rgal3]|uniref:sodium:solute symporter family protein n=1 Tax=Natrarchaeobius versutus TaxID=1679078 RepID=UPI00350F1262
MSGTLIIAGVGAFLAVCIAIGLYMARRVEGQSENYIVAGRGLILPIVAATLMAQSLDANATLGNTDLAADFGFWAGAALPVGLAACLIICGLFFAKPLNRMNLMTLPDFFRRRYNRPVEIFGSIVTCLSFTILLAGNLVAGGFLFETFLGTSYVTGIAILGVIILLYTLTGGLFAVAYTDIIQASVALVGSIALLAWIAINYGITIPDGMGPGATEQLTDPEAGAMINWAQIVALAFGNLVALDFNERVLAAESPETAQRACFAAAVGTLVIGLPFSIVALSAPEILVQAGVQADGVPVLYALMQDVVPTSLAILVLAGIIGASLSTGDGAVLATSSVIARNIAGIRVEETQYEATEMDRLLLFTRIIAVPIAVIGAFFAIRLPETGLLLVLAFDISLAGVVVPYVLGMYWSKANAPAAIAAIVTGAVSRIGLFVLMPETYGLENTLLYVPNDVFTPAFDGYPTFLCLGLALIVFVTVAQITHETDAPEPSPTAYTTVTDDD